MHTERRHKGVIEKDFKKRKIENKIAKFKLGDEKFSLKISPTNKWLSFKDTTIQEGIEAMRNELSNWLLTPEKLIRAGWFLFIMLHSLIEERFFVGNNKIYFCCIYILDSYPGSCSGSKNIFFKR